MDKEQLNSKFKEIKKQAGSTAQKTKENLEKVFGKDNVKENLKKARSSVEKAVGATMNSSFVKKMSPGQKYAALGVCAFIVVVLIALIGRSLFFSPDPSIWCVAEAPKSELAFSSAGEVVEVSFVAKQVVSKGDIIARLRDEAYIADLENAESKSVEANLKFLRMENRLTDMESELAELRIKAAESANEAAITAFKLARAYEEQHRTYFENRMIIEAQYLSTLADVANAEAVMNKTENELLKAKQHLETVIIGHTPEEIANAKEEAEAAVEQVAKARAAIEGTLIVAPFGAYMNKISINVGDSVESGKPVCEVIDLSGIWLRGLAKKTESVKQGALVKVEFREIPRETFTGKIISITPEPVEQRNGEDMYELRIELDSSSDSILPEMEAVAIVISD